MAKSPEDMAQTMIANLREKTGKTLAQWLKLPRNSDLEKHGKIISFLKTEHGVTHGFVNLIGHRFLETGNSPAPVAAQYAGAKAELKPIYDALVKAVQKFGRDVNVSPRKSYVSLRRSKQFAIIQPSTKTRVDLGINLKGEPPKERLEAAGSFNSMVSHRVRLTSVADVDKEVLGWLKAAWDRA